jgi:hypothetical protein
MARQSMIIIHRSYSIRDKEGNLIDFGLRVIKHKESYVTWNDEKKDWDTVNVKCDCEICKERANENQLSIF